MHKEAVVRELPVLKTQGQEGVLLNLRTGMKVPVAGARWGGQWARALSRKVVEQVDALDLWRAVRAIAEFDVSGLWSVVIFTFLKEPSSLQSRKQDGAGWGEEGHHVGESEMRSRAAVAEHWAEIGMRSAFRHHQPLLWNPNFSTEDGALLVLNEQAVRISVTVLEKQQLYSKSRTFHTSQAVSWYFPTLTTP